MKCLFCSKKMNGKKSYGICPTCKIRMLNEMKKPEYVVMVRGEDVKLVNKTLAKEFEGQGYESR